VQSVDRAFAVLEAVAAAPAGVTAIAERVALPKSTVARMLRTLEELGAVERLDGPRWRVGPRVAGLAGAATPERSLAAIARPHLARLVAECSEDAGLALPDGYEVHYVDHIESDNPVQVRDWTGTRAPLHTVPSGIVLLAEWPDDAVDAYVARGLQALTPQTVTDGAVLRRRLAEARRAGSAWGREEFAQGISSVAAPVRDHRGKAVAALHVHGPAYRFPPARSEERISALVVAAAQAAGRELALQLS
jgi:DNA-binding IclR family transcriptional regulator